jgi:hypothetical protein
MVRGSRTDRGSHHEGNTRAHHPRVDLFLRRLRKMPAPRNAYVVERGLRVPTRDGFVLLSDHYAPVVSGSGSGTILIRASYGRGQPLDALWCRTFAARGYHVVLQSCRGTFGSIGAISTVPRSRTGRAQACNSWEPGGRRTGRKPCSQICRWHPQRSPFLMEKRRGIGSGWITRT